MGLRRVEPRASKNESRGHSSRSPRPNLAPAEASLQWVTARVPPALVRDIEAHAKHSGTTRSEAIREC
jgi:Ribbon-helix-helix protein, copG family